MRRGSLVALSVLVAAASGHLAHPPVRLPLMPSANRRACPQLCEQPSEASEQRATGTQEVIGVVTPTRDATRVNEVAAPGNENSGASQSSLPSLRLPRLEKLSIAEDTSGYLVLGLCCAIATISSLDRVLMSVAILPMSAELLYSDTTKGLIAAAFTTGYFLFFVPAGVVAATFSPSATLSVGLVVWSLAQAATPTGNADQP